MTEIQESLFYRLKIRQLADCTRATARTFRILEETHLEFYIFERNVYHNLRFSLAHLRFIEETGLKNDIFLAYRAPSLFAVSEYHVI